MLAQALDKNRMLKNHGLLKTVKRRQSTKRDSGHAAVLALAQETR